MGLQTLYYIFLTIFLTYAQTDNRSIADLTEFNEGLLQNFTTEELNVFEDALKQNSEQSILPTFDTTINCDGPNLTCQVCVECKLGKISHEVCLKGAFKTETLGFILMITFDGKKVWGKEIEFTGICLMLPKPLNKMDICMNFYRVELFKLPLEAAICINVELILLIPILSIDFNCLRYEKGKGIFFDWATSSESKALIDININGGDPKITFNPPIPKEILYPILEAIQEQRQKIVELQYELTEQMKKEMNEGNWWDAFIASLGAGASMGLGIS